MSFGLSHSAEGLGVPQRAYFVHMPPDSILSRGVRERLCDHSSPGQISDAQRSRCHDDNPTTSEAYRSHFFSR